MFLRITRPASRIILRSRARGPTPCTSEGVPGAYFVDAQEFDYVGIFDDVGSARAALMSDHGDFLVDGKDAE
jgi:hypothetical protein